MSDPKLERFLESLRVEFPDYVVACFPYRSSNDDAIEHFIHLLDVPEDDLTPATHRAYDIAAQLHGEQWMPFFLTTIDPQISAEYFPEQLAEAGRGWIPVDVPSTIGTVATHHLGCASTHPAPTWQPDHAAPAQSSERRCLVKPSAGWDLRSGGSRIVAPGVALRSAGSLAAGDLLENGYSFAA